MEPYTPEVSEVSVNAVHVGIRRRPVDMKVVHDIAQSIERQGLLQPIGVRSLTVDEAEALEARDGVVWLVFGAHRLAAYALLRRDTIEVRLLPEGLSEEEYLLIELQENSARNDLTGAQRKAYAAEVGQLLAKMSQNGEVANRHKFSLEKLAETTNIPRRTLVDWWHAFCQETERIGLKPHNALEVDEEAFFAWLQDHQAAEAAERARKEAEAAAARQRQDLVDALENLETLARDYGRQAVIDEVITVFLDGGATE